MLATREIVNQSSPFLAQNTPIMDKVLSCHGEIKTVQNSIFIEIKNSNSDLRQVPKIR
jgi:hypothetical protein